MLKVLRKFATFFIAFVLVEMLITVAGERYGRDGGKDNTINSRDEGGDNYVITHYGKEYYTPVRSSEIQIRDGGYFNAEVIPVDVNTGQELKTVKNIFVPMRTGYTVGAGVGVAASPLLSAKRARISMVTAPAATSIAPSDARRSSSLTAAALTTTKQIENEVVENINSKRKLPKKFNSDGRGEEQ